MEMAPLPPARRAAFSSVLETPPASPDAARDHYASRLAFETDAADVMADLRKAGYDPERAPFVWVDVRSPEAYAACHVPGARNLPTRRITAASTAGLSKDVPIVTYCWGPGCNGATKAALRLAELGFSVKEMIGGMEYWRHEGGETEGALGPDAPLYG